MGRSVISVLAAGVVALLCTSPLHAQQGGKSVVRILGAQLKEWLAHDAPFAGVVHANGCVFLITGPAERRTRFFSCPDGGTEILTGQQRVEGDLVCATWSARPPNVCHEWYGVGENRFELRIPGKGIVAHTLYKLR